MSAYSTIKVKGINSLYNKKHTDSKIRCLGLIIKSKHQSNKLHLTLMNTTFQINKEEKHSKNFITFDAREILKVNILNYLSCNMLVATKKLKFFRLMKIQPLAKPY